MPLLGCIADDFTGATDLCSMLVRNGMRTVQLIGVPDPMAPAPVADAVVVALKSRSIPPAEAVAQSLAALDWLKSQGCRQILFKYCSTFDSTAKGNIGPVADALVEALDCGFALVCPAFPANGRSVYQGHLFVGDRLLNESGMENHPLTPMRDADLVRVLGAQSTGRVGLIPLATVEQGASAVGAACDALKRQGFRYAVADAVRDENLREIGRSACDERLITGGSGIAMGLPANYRALGLLASETDAAVLPEATGFAAVVAGSCSRATLEQIEVARKRVPALRLDPLATPDAAVLTRQALDWAGGHLGAQPIIVFASSSPEQVAALQGRMGAEKASALIEETLAAVAEGLVAKGVRRLVVAGGETAGAVVSRLGVRSLRVGGEIDPGVPWTYAESSRGGLHLALKSGNFGAPDFFLKAFA